jgi:uroporphyrinogen-III decarboxylase
VARMRTCEASTALVGQRQILLGGIDPVRILQDGSPQDVMRAVEACQSPAGPRYIVGGGCEIPSVTPHTNMLALAACARK